MTKLVDPINPNNNEVKPKFLMYAYRDEKVGSFTLPFSCLNVHVAKRDFQTALSDQRSNVGRYPDDFVLYEIGTYDETIGAIKGYASPVYIIRGSELISQIHQSNSLTEVN